MTTTNIPMCSHGFTKLHSWSKWKTYKDEVKESYYKKFRRVILERECRKCNFKAFRTEDIDL